MTNICMPSTVSHWYTVYMDSSSCEQTGHHCRVKEYNIPLVEWFSAYRNRKAVQNALHIIYIEYNIILFVIYKPSLLIAWCNAQCKRPPTEYWKRFTALGWAFWLAWLEIIIRFNYPMAQVSACSHISPSDDRLLISSKICFSNPCKGQH